MARGFAAEHLAPNALAWDAEGHFPIEQMRAAAALGLAGIYVSADSGGSGLTRLDAALVFEELSAGCVATAAYISIHNMVCWMIDAFGNDAQKAEHLPSLLSMERLASYCLTEPGSGSDAASLKTSARRDGDDYILNGGKAFISGGGVSDLYLVMARSGGGGADGVSAFLIEKGTKGLSFGANEHKMGWKSQPTSQVMFDECRIPARNRLGAEGHGFKFAMKGLDGGRINIGACSLGGARFAMEKAALYASERKQFGKALIDFQSVEFKLADMATDFAAAQMMIWRGASAIDSADPRAAMKCAQAKRFATDACFRIVDEALQIHGGYGYIRDYGIERALRDLRVHRILEGTNEIMRLVTARRLIKDLGAGAFLEAVGG